MTRYKKALVLGLSVLAVVVPASFTIRAQSQSGSETRQEPDSGRVAGKGESSIQDALLRPFDFPFAKPTPLEQVAAHLSRALRAPVVIDKAALDRLGLKADDDVQLSLNGIRLKTGLRLLLDQLDMTYRVEAEDNLLVLTDHGGANDWSASVLAELKSLHRDMHDLQDAVDELSAAMGVGDEGGPKVHKPTIIEEVPAPEATEKGRAKDAPAAKSPRRTRPGI
jgi:hypothetical protein